MARKSLNDLGTLQRAVMETVWHLGQATVHQVRNHLKRRKRLAYTSVLSVMQKLEKAGWLRHRLAGRTYVYRAVRTREEAGISSFRSFLDNVFDGDRLRAFQHLLEDETLSNDDLRTLRRMIDERRKGDTK